MFRSAIACFGIAVLSANAAQLGKSWTAVEGSAVPDSTVQRNNNVAVRLEAAEGSGNAAARSEVVNLVIGKVYELSGWAKTQGLTVKDSDRSPIASGATLRMESMPFDVHTASLGGTEDWTRLSLRFVATKEQDRIELTAGAGGSLQGKAWFEGVSVDEASSEGMWPAKEAVRTFGPAYRYPQAGWIYLHIEGKPYERGYQHGYLMAREIPEYLTRCAIDLGGKADEHTWDTYRTTANALFLRGFDKEILEEMQGITDGANAAGAKFLGRKLDLIDIVLANTEVELNELAAAMPMTATGMEGMLFAKPAYADHCSAFAATGSATRDGKMVIGHVTWWPQTLAEQTNVMLDIKPEHGHRMLIQSYPGGIESGTDWYQNDAGMVLTETTIRQTPFEVTGTPVAYRARMAIQYGGNVDEMVKLLGTRNNGLYTNEWMIGDAKNNEIAMYELGTKHTKLWRSSKGEWFGGTRGFYWGDNNSKDLSVNLEYLPDPKGEPEYVPYVPGTRDLAWMNLYEKNAGKIDEQFGFKAFDHAPLVAASTMDAKIATADMANHFMMWAEFGRPNESIAPPRKENHGLFPGGYVVISGEPSEALRSAIAANEKARLSGNAVSSTDQKATAQPVSFRDRTDELWKGWLLPESEDDVWFVAGSVEYEWLLRGSDDVSRAVEREKIRYRGLALGNDNANTRFEKAQTAGVLFLDSLRVKMGDSAFLKLMNTYYAEHTTQTVSARSFLAAAGATYQKPDLGDGPAYLPPDIRSRLATAVIVYGTIHEAGTNRYTAEQLQASYRERLQREVPILKDFEASESLLSGRDVILVGRPETNSALDKWSRQIGLSNPGEMFTVDGKTYASERNGLVFAAKNPKDERHMVLVYAGNSPLETARSIEAAANDGVFNVLEDGKPATKAP